MKNAMARAGMNELIILEDLVDIGFDQGIAKGREEGLRTAIFAVAEILALSVDDERRRWINALDHEELIALLERLKRLRTFD